MSGWQQPSGSGSSEFHCWHASDLATALSKGRFIVEKFARFLRPGPVVDLGCGEGALLLALKEAGHTDLTGVDSNRELCALAASFGVRVMQADLHQYLTSAGLPRATFFYLDVIEHVPFELNARLFGALPQGSRLIVQTPNTESVLGHQFYMNVPSHLAPYSPWMIRKMLERSGYEIVAEGSVEGEHPPTWKNRLRALFIRTVLGLRPEVLLGGANYFIVADRICKMDGNDAG